jgi:RimJ/RimL family protein N-acetyltransferase
VTVYATERLVIREWTEEPADLARVFDTYSRWEVARWLGSEPRAMTDPAEAVERVRGWCARNAEYGPPYGIWAVQVRRTGVVAGSVLLRRLPDADGSPTDDVEVGWHLHPDSWGRGYATEAARGAAARAFAAGIAEVYAVVYAGNAASVAVTRRLGMRPLGTTDRWYGRELDAFVLRAPGPAAGSARST